jgi:hypothetical protein
MTSKLKELHPEKDIFEEVIKLTVFNRQQINLTLIDMPGICYFPP